MDIDYVIPYVNMDDPNWQKLYRKYVHKDPKKNANRFRDLGTLKYQFRGIEKHMSWIRNIYLILQSPSQIPKWLNTKHPKLKIVYHNQFIPKRYLPTFNSSVIEMWYHLIPGISDKFIVSNDDMIPINDSPAENFFRNDKPIYPVHLISKSCKLEKRGIWNHTLFNSRKFSSRIAGKKTVYKFSNYHLLVPLTKSLYNNFWKKGKDIILRSIENSRIRNIHNCNGWMFEYFGLLTNQGLSDINIPHDGYMQLDSNFDYSILDNIDKINTMTICLNDVDVLVNVDTDKIISSLNKFLPKSQFEL